MNSEVSELPIRGFFKILQEPIEHRVAPNETNQDFPGAARLDG
jgi:hypothetical protein